MDNNETQILISQLEQQIRDLTSQLSCNSSAIGDWKISKCMEYQLLGKELPYDINELNKKRQEIRNAINDIELQIKVLTTQE